MGVAEGDRELLPVGVVEGDAVEVLDLVGVVVPLKDTVGELEEVKEMVGETEMVLLALGDRDTVLEALGWKQAAAEVAPGPGVVKPAAQEVQLAAPVPLA
jgi:hypothetical protein